ncbi:hypothetical protein BANRA_02775 [Acinetobacter baumannii]|nr:hypothetical protein BANRA_02775 [Acinetobacter baumannii]
METGGFEPFQTEALLLASTPTVSPKAKSYGYQENLVLGKI